MFYNNLETERLILKNIDSDDREFIYHQFSDDEVNRYLFDAEPLSSLEDADDLIAFYQEEEPRSHHRWVITRKSDGMKIGTCGLHCWDQEKSKVEIGYDLKKDDQGKGYIVEALSEMIEFIKREMKVQRINACIYVGNQRSIQLVQKFGFEFSGTMNELFRGNRYEHHIYSLEVEQSAR